MDVGVVVEDVVGALVDVESEASAVVDVGSPEDEDSTDPPPQALNPITTAAKRVFCRHFSILSTSLSFCTVGRLDAQRASRAGGPLADAVSRREPIDLASHSGSILRRNATPAAVSNWRFADERGVRVPDA